MSSDRWYTIETAHFRVHFTKELEGEARRGAANAERAWAELSAELRAPRGKVDLVIADNVDFVNGYASVFPFNRIVIYAHPPVFASELRNYDDWSRLVITHELAHIFHLDRADGVWGLGRKVFGRHPALFPNGYQPSWLIEGLAVYYESRLTGAGRLEGSEHFMIARAAAEARRLPRIGELSRETSRFPGGQVVYVYGSHIFDHIARTKGPETIPKFLDVSSKVLLPLSLNRKAKRAFGISFENAWRDWRDSMVAASDRGRDPLPGWRELTKEGRTVAFPRWLGDTSIVYAASTGKEVAAAYVASLDGKIDRLGRRNGLSPNVRMPDGSILFSQIDYTDAFHLRNDLYSERGSVQRRLTHGARLSHPDASTAGAIIAVQSLPGTTRIVRVSGDGRTISPLTSGTEETQWAEPRWSPDGRSIAAVRMIRGRGSEIVVLDSTGRVRGVAVSDRAVLASPSWSTDGRRLYFTSDRSGVTQAYSVAIADPVVPSPVTRLSNASTGVFNPVPSPDGRSLAALGFSFDGYHLGYSTAAREGLVEREAASPRAACRNCVVTGGGSGVETAGAPVRPYSALRSLAPHYWEPVVSSSPGDGTIIGAATGGEDAIGRHAYGALYQFGTARGESEGFFAYRYAGLGQPFLNFSASQEWEHFGIVNRDGDDLGILARRERVAGVSATFVRPRARTSASFSLGADIELRDYRADPDSLGPLLVEGTLDSKRYPSVFATAGWSNTKFPSLAISREDGIAVSATARQRWRSDDFSSASRSLLGVVQGYKSLDLPGFAHHVIAVRVAGAVADRRAISTYSVGGLSGGSLEVISGVSVGSRRTFGVRGFSPSSQQGVRAAAGTLEYRAPIGAPSRRLPFIPLLFDKISVAAFGEAGRAWCPADDEGLCSVYRGGPWLGSVGGEADFDTAILYDFPARLRLGVAVPVQGRAAAGANRASLYFTVGSSF
ncbi:MAG TPA: hypothetical protein VFX40_05045 [Gemmatimonadaceae bacterium]|nr:hypothetical protein [Gemmatimonadaceae bacterium]